MTNSTDIGRRGEFLAAYVLESYGIECHHVNRHEADLWCKMPNGTLVPVQVKACSKPSFDKRWPTPLRYSFNYRKMDKNLWVACVALDVEIVLLFSPGKPGKWVRKELFTEQEQGRRVQEFLQRGAATT